VRAFSIFTDPLTSLVETYRQRLRVVSAAPAVRVRLEKSTCQLAGHAVEANELADAVAPVVVLLGAAVEAQHYRRHVAEYCRAHQRWFAHDTTQRTNKHARCLLQIILEQTTRDRLHVYTRL